MCIRKGETIDLVGENGSGKSTFVSLMTGLYEPTKGQILVNGVDISESLGLLRGKMSSTMQDFLHHQDTVAENIRLGDITKNHTDEEIQVVLEKAGLAENIAESKLYEEFSALTGDKTVILISHRLGATRLADRVLVFHDGQIVEDGTHEELMINNQLYTQMYHSQSQWYVEN